MSPTAVLFDLRLIVAILRTEACGIDHPMSNKELLARLGLDFSMWHPLREFIDDALEEGVPIGSTTNHGSAGGGYYWMETYRDFDIFRVGLRARLVKGQRRLDAVERMMPENPQGSLF